MGEPSDSPLPGSPFHPSYGLPDTCRQRALREAERTSVAEAAEMFNVHTSTIYKWKKFYRVETGE